MVYILNQDGTPLMPSRDYKKAKRLLKEGKAVAIQSKPFTIRLAYQIEAPVIDRCLLGIDPGRTNIGLCAIDSKGMPLFASDAVTRNKEISRLMRERRLSRGQSRSGEHKVKRRRKVAAEKKQLMDTVHRSTGLAKETAFLAFLTYCEPEIRRMLPGCKKPVRCKGFKNKEARFNNRKRPIGWMNATCRHLLQTHLNLIEKAVKLVPISSIVIEINRFDFARMENPDIKNWEYQQGRLFGFKDKHDAIYHQQKGKCLLCGGKIEHYHHLVPLSRGGSDPTTPCLHGVGSIDNQAGLCCGCHDKVHKYGSAKEKLAKKKEGMLKKYGALSVVNTIMPYLLDEVASRYELSVTAGWDTMRIREYFGLDKDHCIDAYCIAMSMLLDVDEIGPDEKAPEKPGFKECYYDIKQFRRHDRARICAQKERTYYLNGKAVCKNRHKRTGQDKTDYKGRAWDSLAEFRQAHPDLVCKLTVRRSKRSYNSQPQAKLGVVGHRSDHAGGRIPVRGEEVYPHREQERRHHMESRWAAHKRSQQEEMYTGQAECRAGLPVGKLRSCIFRRYPCGLSSPMQA